MRLRFNDAYAWHPELSPFSMRYLIVTIDLMFDIFYGVENDGMRTFSSRRIR